VSTYQEWLDAGGQLRLNGGPCDGQTVDPRGFQGWPSFIRKIDPAANAVACYRMRVGDLEHYDFAGYEDASGNPIGLPVEGGG
jgi:hypothetical protein